MFRPKIIHMIGEEVYIDDLMTTESMNKKMGWSDVLL